MTKATPFSFELKQHVALCESNEEGIVVGRTEFDHSEPQYLVRYCAANGRQTEAWWGESAIMTPVG